MAVAFSTRIMCSRHTVFFKADKNSYFWQILEILHNPTAKIFLIWRKHLCIFLEFSLQLHHDCEHELIFLVRNGYKGRGTICRVNALSSSLRRLLSFEWFLYRPKLFKMFQCRVSGDSFSSRFDSKAFQFWEFSFFFYLISRTFGERGIKFLNTYGV